MILCGRYEGVDERVRERVTEELSIGDYVLTGGELPALVMLDAVARLVPGVVGDEQSVADDSFSRGLLDFPQYTRPATLDGDGTAMARRTCRCPTCCCRAITPISGDGESAKRSRGRSSGGRICWPVRTWTTKSGRSLREIAGWQEKSQRRSDEKTWRSVDREEQR